MQFPEFDPVLFSIGPLDIRWYALAYVGGIVVGWWYAARLAKANALWQPGKPPVTTIQICATRLAMNMPRSQRGARDCASRETLGRSVVSAVMLRAYAVAAVSAPAEGARGHERSRHAPEDDDRGVERQG